MLKGKVTPEINTKLDNPPCLFCATGRDEHATRRCNMLQALVDIADGRIEGIPVLIQEEAIKTVIHFRERLEKTLGV